MNKTRTRFGELLKTVREKLGTDPAQNTAFGHMVKFFLLMLLLTLLARGLAGVSMAQVELDAPTQQTIVHSIQTTGTITPQGETVIAVPAGLVVAEIPVEPGDYVAEDTVLVRFDEGELERALLRKAAQLEQMYVQLDALRDGQRVSDAVLSAAKTDWERSFAAFEQAQQRLSDAQNALSSAEQTLTVARSALAELLEEAEEAESENEPTEPSLTHAIEQAQSVVEEAETQLQLARGEKETAEELLLTAKYGLLDADARLESAKEDYAEASEQSQRTDRSNAAAAELLELDIAEFLGEIDILEEIKLSGCCLRASEPGEVRAVPLTILSRTTGMERITITTAVDGYLLCFQTTAEESERLLDAMPVLKISQGAVTDEVELSAADRETEADGSVTFRLLLDSVGWSGQTVNLTAELSRNTYTTCIPLSALHQDARGCFVYVFRSESNLLGTTNRAERVDVSVEDMDTRYAAISGALGIEDYIIVSGNKPISDGDRVRVKP